jgi:FkbM family methyltransferase
VDELGVRIAELSKYTADSFEVLCSRQSMLSASVDVSLRRVYFPLDNRRALIRTEVGYMICDRKDASLIAMLIESGELEPGLRLFLSRFLGEGMVFVDVGAHIGMHSIAAARIVGATGRVFSFDATPDNADFLRQNVTQNGFSDRVLVEQCFVGAATGVTDFHICPISGLNSKYPVPNEIGKLELPVVALDTALHDVGSVNLVKIDVEGAEVAVFAGMRELMRRSPDACVVAEFAPIHLKRSGAQIEDWEAFCKEHGLTVYEVGETDGRLRSASFSELMSKETANVLMARGAQFKKCI